jgi:DNA-binding MarR family transcriptional regulator
MKQLQNRNNNNELRSGRQESEVVTRPRTLAPRASLKEQSRELVANLDALFHRLLFARPGPAATEIDLSRLDIRALGLLRHRGSLTMSELSADLSVPVSTATHVIDRLVKKGLVVRVRSELDRRVVQVELSDAGNEMEKMHLKLRLAMAQDMLNPLTLEERETFLELMTKMSRLATLDNSKSSTL